MFCRNKRITRYSKFSYIDILGGWKSLVYRIHTFFPEFAMVASKLYNSQPPLKIWRSRVAGKLNYISSKLDPFLFGGWGGALGCFCFGCFLDIDGFQKNKSLVGWCISLTKRLSERFTWQTVWAPNRCSLWSCLLNPEVPKLQALKSWRYISIVVYHIIKIYHWNVGMSTAIQCGHGKIRGNFTITRRNRQKDDDDVDDDDDDDDDDAAAAAADHDHDRDDPPVPAPNCWPVYRSPRLKGMSSGPLLIKDYQKSSSSHPHLNCHIGTQLHLQKSVGWSWDGKGEEDGFFKEPYPPGNQHIPPWEKENHLQKWPLMRIC